MLIVYLLLSSRYLCVYCGIKELFEEPQNNQNLVICVNGVLRQYFSKYKAVTYVNINYTHDDVLLGAIHSMTAVPVVYRLPTIKSPFPNEGYLITSEKISDFTEGFPHLAQEAEWNPFGRFLIIMKLLSKENLKQIFDTLLRLHVINVLIISEINDGHLYTYNPYDNFACGRYYNIIISYGMCSLTTNKLYPNKLVNGLQNCTITATVPHRPPFTIHPSNNLDKNHMPAGFEQNLFELIAEFERFKVKFDYNYASNLRYSTITADMQAVGPLSKIQNNETEAMLGALMLVNSRAKAFSYLHGYLDYVDQLLFIVKKAPFVVGWKYFYLEFTPIVWCLLLMAFVTYSALIIFLLHPKDKAKVTLKLFDTLFNHSYHLKCQLKVKCILIIWVWFAYLINNYYTSTLVSFATHPLIEYQISTEKDLIEYNLKPCVTPQFQAYLLTEMQKRITIKEECNGSVDYVKMVSESEDLYTITQESMYYYNIKQYLDEFGQNTVYSFQKPFGKFLFAIYFYKGFPGIERMRMTSLYLRENGLADKNAKNLFTVKLAKLHFRNEEFKIRSSLPWCLYFAGCVLSTLAFIVEIAAKYNR